MRKLFTFPTVILVILPTVSLVLVLVGWDDWSDFLQTCIAMFLGFVLRFFVDWRKHKKLELQSSEQ
jgi:uncharacterized membrane protein YjjP (DUF1212 family)